MPVFTRLNTHYRTPVELANRIIKSMTYQLRSGSTPSWAFLIDMNVVFEDFVHAAFLDLSPPSIGKLLHGHALSFDIDSKIEIRPDLSWWKEGRCVFVADAKYKRIVNDHAPNQDLYQLLAYTEATGLPGGTLIYAKGECDPSAFSTRTHRRELEVVALDLSQSPDDVLLQISQLGRRFAETAQRAWVSARSAAAPIRGMSG